MSAGAPWSVKGIDPKAREIAKDLARREGLTLGDWLNRVIMDDPPAGDRGGDYDPPPFAAQEFDRLGEALQRLTAKVESAEHRSTLAISGIDQTVLGLLSRLESAEREHVAVGARFEGALEEIRAEQAQAHERIAKVEEEAAQPRSVEALRALEAALGKVAGHLYDSETRTRETLSEVRAELGGMVEKVRKLEETDTAPSQAMIDGVVSRIVQRLEDAELRTSSAIRRLESSVSEFDHRLHAAETRDEGPEQRLEQLAAELTRNFANFDQRLQAAEARDEGPDQRLEQLTAELSRNFVSFDQRLHAAESREEAAEQRLEQLAADLTRSLDTAQDGLAARLQETTETRFASIERSLQQSLHQMSGQMKAADQRTTQAMERMGHEVFRVAETLGKRMEGVETRSAEAMEQVGGEVSRIAEAMEGRLRKADQLQAESLERLGVEIARITERLADRIGNAERRSAQAIDDVGEQVSRISEKLNQRQERSSSELVDRIRQSEERTARLLEEAREKIDQRLAGAERRLSEQVATMPQAAPTPDSSLFAEPDLPPGPFGSLAFAPEPFSSPAFPEDSAPVEPAPRSLGALAAKPVSTSSLSTGSVAAAPLSVTPPAPSLRSPSAPVPSPVSASAPFDGFPADGPTPSQRPAPDPLDETVVSSEPFSPTSLASTLLPALDAEEPSERDTARDAFAPAAFARRGDAPAGFVPPVESLPAEPQQSPFQGDDFDATEMFEALAASQAAPPVVEPEPVDEDLIEAASQSLQGGAEPAAYDYAPTPEGPARASTRDLIAQARAAARAAQEGGGASDPNRKPLFTGFGAKKDKPNDRLKSLVAIAAGAATLGVSAAGLTLYSAQSVGRHGSHDGADQVQANHASAGDAGGGETPQVAVALAPQLAPAESEVNLQSLYADAVRRIEAKDAAGVRSLRRAADLGYPPAQFYMAKLYESGDVGVPKNVIEARKWTERAAQGGDRKAMHNLALNYFEGSGGPKNLTMAAQWFSRAADLGLVDSQYNLARLYEEGYGVSQNPAEAYKWYLIAARSGDAESRAAADRIKRRLSVFGQKAAEHSAQAFTPEPPPVMASTAAAPSDVVVAQHALAKLGYYKGPSDGLSSPALKLAIQAFQRDQGLPATGTVDHGLTSHLAKASG